MDYNDLLEKAKEVCKNAYAPFSGFTVGACVLCASGKTYVGCNIETPSNIMTLCAERNAIANAVANGDTKIIAVAVYAAKREDCLCCGFCRLILLEFQADKDVDIITQVGSSYKVRKLSDLLPESYML